MNHIELIIIGWILAAVPLSANAASARIAGTYSSFFYSAEGGDLLGYEVRLIPTSQGLKAVVQSAQGEAGDLYVVEVKRNANGISFDIPDLSGKPGRFTGNVVERGLEGTIRLPTGDAEKVFLRRTTSHWERLPFK